MVWIEGCYVVGIGELWRCGVGLVTHCGGVGGWFVDVVL